VRENAPANKEFAMPDFASLAKEIAEQVEVARSSLEQLIKK